MFAPAATPKPVVDKLYGAVAAVLTRAEQKDGLAKQMMSRRGLQLATGVHRARAARDAGWGEFCARAREYRSD